MSTLRHLPSVLPPRNPGPACLGERVESNLAPERWGPEESEYHLSRVPPKPLTEAETEARRDREPSKCRAQ